MEQPRQRSIWDAVVDPGLPCGVDLKSSELRRITAMIDTRNFDNMAKRKLGALQKIEADLSVLFFKP